MRAVLRWSLFVIFVAGGLVYLNSAVFHAWAADVPPRLYPGPYRAMATRHLLISVASFILSGASVWLLRHKRSGGGKPS